MCVVSLPGNPLLSALSPEQIERALSWRRPRLEFNDVRLEQALTEINRLNLRQIRLSDPALGGLRISGTFAPDDPETFARLVAMTFDLVRSEGEERDIVLAPR
jgi:transmembrane sensor